MAVTYTWSVNTLKKKNIANIPGVVVQAYWTKTGTDETGAVGVYPGTMSFTLNPDSEFIPFEELTNEIVLGWIQDRIANDSLMSDEAINIYIQRQIDDKNSNKTPWQLLTTT
jgi:hypothetical protein